MPTPEQLARFFDDRPSAPAAPVTKPSTRARGSSSLAPGKPQPSAADRRARFYDDMKQERPADASEDDAAARRRSEAFEAQRNTRRAKLYDDDPRNAGAENPAAAKSDATGKTGPTGDGKATDALKLQAPEGFDASSEAWKEFTATAAELRLDAKGAERLLQMHQAEQVRVKDASMDAWEAATRTDREIGGERLEGTIADAREVLERNGTPELHELLDDSGLGSHPEVLRLLARVSRTTRRGW